MVGRRRGVRAGMGPEASLKEKSGAGLHFNFLSSHVGIDNLSRAENHAEPIPKTQNPKPKVPTSPQIQLVARSAGEELFRHNKFKLDVNAL